jgi:hypothetical protein
VRGIAFHPDGQHILADSYARDSSGLVLRFLDMKAGLERLRLAHDGEILISPDVKRLFVGVRDATINMYSLEDLQDAAFHSAMAPFLALGAEGELHDGLTWVPLWLHGRLSRQALAEHVPKIPRPIGLKLVAHDEDLLRLPKAKNVKRLDLTECLFRSEDVLKHLQKMTWLEEIRLSILNEEVAVQLRKALPKTKVVVKEIK